MLPTTGNILARCKLHRTYAQFNNKIIIIIIIIINNNNNENNETLFNFENVYKIYSK